MNGPPKETGAPAKSARLNTELTAAYRLLSLLQAPLGFIFWLIEQRKPRLQDRIDNGNDRDDEQ